MQPDKVVENGCITLSSPASRVIVGLGYQTQVQTLDLEMASRESSTAQGNFKKITQVSLKLENTRGIKVGPTFEEVKELKQRSGSVPMGSPIPLFTGNTFINTTPAWTIEGRVCIQQDHPLPMTVLAIIPDVLLGSDTE